MRSSVCGSAARGPASHQEMPRIVDPFHRQPRAPGDFHVDERQRDGNAGAPIHHLVEEAVPRILVVGFVSREADFVEQQFVQRQDSGVDAGVDAGRSVGGRRRQRQTATGFDADEVELGEIPGRVDVRIFDARDHQRGGRELGIGAQRRIGEAANRAAAAITRGG